MDKRKYFLIISIVITYICGCIGYQSLFPNDILEILYATTSLFFMSVAASAEEVNGFIEMARWSACFVSIQAVLLFVQTLFSKAKSASLIKDDQLVVLHGDYSDIIEKRCKNAVVFTDDILWKAKRHVLCFDKDEDAFAYITKNEIHVNAEKQIYVMSKSITQSHFAQNYIHVCNVSEMCARHYWRTYPLLFEDCKIAIIGNGSYVEELLNYAILLNVITPCSQVEYHVFTCDTTYLLKHPNVSQCVSINKKAANMDSLFIHNVDWKKEYPLLESCDRIIVADEKDSENVSILNCLKRDFTCDKRIDVRYLSEKVIHDLWGKDIFVFGKNDDVYTEEYILNDQSYYVAKNIHAKYFEQYVCKNDACKKQCLKCKAFLDDWNGLSLFFRYSNIAQGDHMYYKIRILEHMKKDASQSLEDFYYSLSEEALLRLDEIEHIRWMRYYYFHNWSYDSIRDNKNRKHPLLVPFHDLTYAEKIKDRDGWENVLKFHKKRIL